MKNPVFTTNINKSRMSILTTSLQYCNRSTNQENTAKTTNKRPKTERKNKIAFFHRRLGCMYKIYCIYPKKLLKLISAFSKVGKYKVNTV